MSRRLDRLPLSREQHYGSPRPCTDKHSPFKNSFKETHFASKRKSRAANPRNFNGRPARVAKRRQRAWPGEYGGLEKLYGDRGEVSVSSVQDHRFLVSIQFPLTGASSLVPRGASR